MYIFRLHFRIRHVFTVRRDLPSLCALHAKLTQLLDATDVLPPPFPDPFRIGTVLEDATRQLTPKGYEKRKLRYGQPFVYNSHLRTVPVSSWHSVSSSGATLADHRALDESMAWIQQYLQVRDFDKSRNPPSNIILAPPINADLLRLAYFRASLF